MGPAVSAKSSSTLGSRSNHNDDPLAARLWVGRAHDCFVCRLARRAPCGYHHTMGYGFRIIFLATATIVGADGAMATCQRADFEAVVDEAGGVLRDLNAANKPKFQDKLRQLKTKRGWSQEQFLKEAAPLVADETIQSYDRKSTELLETIASGGQAGAASASPDCAVLEQLRASMKALVDAQTAKWGYMTTRLDAELAK